MNNSRRLFVLLFYLICDSLSASAQIAGRVLEYPSTIEFQSIPCEVSLGNGEQIYPGDFNGDGCSDILIRTNAGKTLSIRSSDCKFGFGPNKPAYSTDSAIDAIVPLSINGDACEDLAIVSSSQLYILLSNCSGNFIPKGLGVRVPDEKRTLSGGVFPSKGVTSVIASSPSKQEGWLVIVAPESHIDFGKLQAQQVFPPDARLIDADGNRVMELLFLSPNNEFFAEPLTGLPNRDEDSIWRAAFPVQAIWQEVYIGDFSGDGRDDLLVHGDGI